MFSSLNFNRGHWFAAIGLALAVGLTTVATDAEAAKRMGSGKSTGMQRDAMPQKGNQAAPAQPGSPAQANPAAAPAAATAAAPAAAASSRPGWMGPVAGLAAGLGLAALASHFGFGEELATMLMLGLAFLLVLAVVGFFLRRRAVNAAQSGHQMAYAGAGHGGNQGAGGFGQPQNPPASPTHTAYTAQPVSSGSAAGVAGGSLIGANLQPSQPGQLPAGFDAEGFARQAKVQFVRLQAAYDSGNLDDIREFTSPEMFAELRMDLAERGAASSTNDVTRIEAVVLDVAEEPNRYVVSVRFSGEMRDTQTHETDAFEEVWHLTKPREGHGGWVLAGIQQVN